MMNKKSQGVCEWRNEFLTVCAGLVGIWLILYSGMANAVFANGDFGTGDFSGWTQQSYLNGGLSGSQPYSGASITRLLGGNFISKVIDTSTALPDLITNIAIPTQYASHVAKINGDDSEGGKNKNMNSISQTASVTSADVDPDGKIHVRLAWSAVLENPPHGDFEQPFFFIAIKNNTKGTTLYEVFEFADAAKIKPNGIWNSTSTGWLYSDWQIFDQGFSSAALAVGDTISIEVIAAGCSQGGHGGYVYVTGFGSNIPGVNLLTVSHAGNGSGVVTSTPTGINCGTDCSETYAPNSSVTLTATPDTGYSFTGWSDDGISCGTATTCAVTMDTDKNVTATFTLSGYDLIVSKTGMGTVTSSNLADINCGTICNKNYAPGTKVTLTATPNSDFVFTGWSGDAIGCGVNPTCILTMDAAKTAIAAFSPGYFLTVTRDGTGAGIVTSSPSGISCGNDCKKLYASGTSVVLTATPLNGSTFTGWGGACSGTATTCTVTMTAAKAVTATFAGASYLLTVNKTGNGKGTIKTSLPGINCDVNCTTASYGYARGTRVTLTATPLLGNTFTGWSGACTGTASTCMVTMDNVKNAVANFKINTYVLKVVKAGTAAGTITSNPAGITNCGGVCSATYDYNTSVILTAAPAATKRFTGWTGACSGTATTCTVPMTAAKTVTATFLP